MHSAPAVTYPVGRSHFQGWLLSFSGLFGILIGLLWCDQTDLAGGRQWLFFLILSGAFVISVHGWCRSPQGRLRWDGQAWHWTCGQASSGGDVAVHLDLQLFLLLSLRTEAGVQLWLWPERGDDVARWNALRRAVFARRANGPQQVKP